MTADLGAHPFETVRCTVADGVATLTLNRPERRNAIDRRMADEMVAALAGLSADPSVRALVFCGAGGAFSAGGDVKDMASFGPRSRDEALAGMARYRRLALALHGFDRPVVAAVDGVAYGAGVSLLLLADFVVLGDRARLCLAFQRIGLLPDCGALHTLTRAVGLQRAKELAFSAREILPDEAVRLGVALEVVPTEGLMPRAEELARAVSRGSATSLALTKRALARSSETDFETMLDIEAEGQADALASDDHRLAVERFLRRARSTPL